MTVRAHVRLSGRVQNVGFRYSTAEEARRAGLAGWVRNLEGGDVEAVFEGDQPVVEQLVSWCRQGPTGAWVRDARVVWDEPVQGFSQFEIRATAAQAE